MKMYTVVEFGFCIKCYPSTKFCHHLERASPFRTPSYPRGIFPVDPVEVDIREYHENPKKYGNRKVHLAVSSILPECGKTCRGRIPTEEEERAAKKFYKSTGKFLTISLDEIEDFLRIQEEVQLMEMAEGRRPKSSTRDVMYYMTNRLCPDCTEILLNSFT